MIPKGNQRSGGRQLATHLLNSYDNERIEVAEVRGSVAQDLHGAFTEWHAISKATRCKKYLYSLSVNPDHRQGPFSREDYFDFINRTEDKLGLTDQPRAVVFHVKEGREHCHVVWSRIDADNLKAIQLSHDRQKLRAIAQEYALDRGLELPTGMRNDRGAERFNDQEKAANLAEKQQEERTGISKEERRQAITDAWRASDNVKSFLNALTQRGYYVARGDRRSFVVVDTFGEVHSLARQIDGVKTKQVKTRFANYPLEQLPDVAGAQDFARQQREALRADNEPDVSVWQRKAELKQAQLKRRTILEDGQNALKERQAREYNRLKQAQDELNQAIAAERQAREAETGFKAFFRKLPGISHYIQARQEKLDRIREETHATDVEFLRRAHERQLADFDRHFKALALVEKREQQSLAVELKREDFNAMGLRKERPKDRSKTRKREERKPDGLKERFTQAAEKTPPADRTKTDTGRQDDGKPPDKGKVSDDLAEALRRRAEKKKRELRRDKNDDPDRSPDER